MKKALSKTSSQVSPPCLPRIKEGAVKPYGWCHWTSTNFCGFDCSHEIKRHLLLGRKAMTKLDSILKSRDITLPTKVCLVKAIVCPVVTYECESWTRLSNCTELKWKRENPWDFPLPARWGPIPLHCFQSNCVFPHLKNKLSTYNHQKVIEENRPIF